MLFEVICFISWASVCHPPKTKRHQVVVATIRAEKPKWEEETKNSRSSITMVCTWFHWKIFSPYDDRMHNNNMRIWVHFDWIASMDCRRVSNVTEFLRAKCMRHQTLVFLFFVCVVERNRFASYWMPSQCFKA